MQKIIAGLKGLGRTKLIALGAVGVLLIVALGVIAIRGGSAPMSLLYGELDLNEASEMVEDLTKAHIPSTSSDDGRSIYVPKDKVASARLLLAKDKLPSGGVVGYELFDKSGTLTSTQFEQGIDQTRAMEGELERSIRLLHGVRNVRVHLVLPHRDLFATQTNPSQASVVLDVGRSGAASEEAIQAILNLVAAAVPGLQSHNISIVDTRGDVLAKPGDPDSLAGQETSLEKQRHAEEQRLAQAVEEMLVPTLGSGHVRAKAAVTMNTDEIHETEESYDPNQQVLRSQQTSTEKSVNTETTPNTSVGNNLPNANASQNNKSGSTDDKTDETNNYEVGKRTRVVNQTRPRVSRISLAVMVDGKFIKDKDGKEVWKALDDAEIKRLTTLAQTAVGYEKARGDEVNVVSMPFRSDGGTDFPREETSFFTKDMLVYIAKWVIPIILFVVAALIILRSMGKGGKEGEGGAGVISELAAEGAAIVSHALHGRAAGEEVSVGNVEGKMRKETLDRVSKHVEENHDECIMIIKGWLSEPAGPQKNNSANK
ncbi:flagellar basal-body MS-ring/collar protein FliF [Acetobacter persici]|uniref:Flagellar M-ring protein n=1 Tax=Acetobacter persici TaxID=1076596 RepID=A0A1U9LIU0_9PROT|nr:flagellar basal-body MS-ring/collar protein FliF [Acetobacter persici]AQT06342.1 flagellar MS-ring protein [Acetobacter persici]